MHHKSIETADSNLQVHAVGNTGNALKYIKRLGIHTYHHFQGMTLVIGCTVGTHSKVPFLDILGPLCQAQGLPSV